MITDRFDTDLEQYEIYTVRGVLLFRSDRFGSVLYYKIKNTDKITRRELQLFQEHLNRIIEKCRRDKIKMVEVIEI